MRSLFLIFKEHWRELLIIASILSGTILIFSTRHMVPVFADVISETIRKDDVAVRHSARISWRIEKPSPDYRLFLPYVSAHRKAEPLPPEPLISIDVFEGIDFSAGSELIRITIFSTGLPGEDGKPVNISFMPGEECVFGDGYGCVNAFSSPAGNRIIFVSVHSGLGGEGDGLRDLIEGTGFNQGLYDPAEVHNRIQKLSESEISILQGEREISGLSLKEIIRIPPELMVTYMDLPFENALRFALEQTSQDQDFVDQDLLIIETCGWQLPNEPQIEGLSQYSSSVYLGIVGMVGD